MSLIDILETEVRKNISSHGSDGKKSYPTHRRNARTESIQSRRYKCNPLAQSGGWGGKTGLYFIDLNKNSKITDTARCIKARYNAGITNRGADNSGVYYACARAVLTPNRLEKRQNAAAL